MSCSKGTSICYFNKIRLETSWRKAPVKAAGRFEHNHRYIAATKTTQPIQMVLWMKLRPTIKNKFNTESHQVNTSGFRLSFPTPITASLPLFTEGSPIHLTLTFAFPDFIHTCRHTPVFIHFQHIPSYYIKWTCLHTWWRNLLCVWCQCLPDEVLLWSGAGETHISLQIPCIFPLLVGRCEKNKLKTSKPNPVVSEWRFNLKINPVSLFKLYYQKTELSFLNVPRYTEWCMCDTEV